MSYVVWLASIVLTSIVMGQPAALAGQAIADLQAKSKEINDHRPAMNTSEYRLWSNLAGPFQAGPNLETYIQRPEGKGVTDIVRPIPAAENNGIYFGGVKRYPDVAGASVVGKAGIAKPPEPASGSNSQSALDTSFFEAPNGGPQFRVTAGADLFRFADGSWRLRANVTRANPDARGSAAAVVWDPGPLTSPSPGYYLLSSTDVNDVVQHTYLLSGMLSPDPGEFLAMEFFGTDDRVGPIASVNLGDLGNNLWSLLLFATGPVTSPSQVGVSFQINPLATVAGGGSANLLTDANGNPLDPIIIQTFIENHVTVRDGVVTLEEVDPFPLGARYYVDRTITYGFASGAALAAVPGPGSIWLLGLALVGVVGSYVRRRRDGKGRGPLA